MLLEGKHNDALAARRAQLNKAPAEELLANGVFEDFFKDALDNVEAGDAFALLPSAFRRIALEHEQSTGPGRERWQLLVQQELDDRAQRQSNLQDLLIQGISAPHKPTATRGQEILQAAISLCLVLPPGAAPDDRLHFLAPLAEAAMRSPTSSKHLTIVLGRVIPLVPVERLPRNAIERAVQGIGAYDFPVHHGRVFTALLQRTDYLESRSKTVCGQQGVQLVAEEVSAIMMSSDDATRTQIGRHVLPSLVKTQPAVVHLVLDTMLRAPSASADPWGYIGPYVDVAAVLVAQSLVTVAELDREVVQFASEHRDETVRLAAFCCLIGSAAPSERIGSEALQMIREWMLLNDNVHHAEFRNNHKYLFTRLCERFEMSVKAARRVLTTKTGATKSESFRAAQAYVDSISEMLEWILHKAVDSAIRLPLMTNHATMITALDTLAAVSTVVTADLDVDLWPASRIEYLLACLSSNFTQIRDRAMSILETVPDPLPGFKNQTDRDFLLACAHESLLGARNTQAEAGQLLLRLLFLKSGPAAKLERANFLRALVDRLEQHVQASERDLAQGLGQLPLHGLLSAITGIVQFLPLTNQESSLPYHDSMRRLRDLIARIWQACAPVLSLSGEGGDHEIARVYDMLDAEDADQGEHLVVLSGCWRAMKEAASLLAVILAVGLRTATPSDDVLLWSPEDVQAAGSLFRQWLHAIRHRGAFSSIAPSFELFVKAVREADAKFGGDDLCRSWLNLELDELRIATASTTRRSAAMPFRILALVHGHDQSFLHAVKVLQEVSSDAVQTETVQTHALNVLRVLVLDGRHAHLLQSAAEMTAVVALDRITSPHWNVKNAALLLFAGVTSRLIGKQIDLPFDAIHQPIPLSAWSREYPNLLEGMSQTLIAAKSDDSHRMAVFPILVVLRNLRNDMGNGVIANDLLRASEPFLQDPEWMIRSVVSEACAALIKGSTAVERIQELLAPLADLTPNARHGRLLLLRALLRRLMAVADAASGLEVVAKQILETWDTQSLSVNASTEAEDGARADIVRLLCQLQAQSDGCQFTLRTGSLDTVETTGISSDYKLRPTPIFATEAAAALNASEVATAWRTALDTALDNVDRTAACNLLATAVGTAESAPQQAFCALLRLAANAFPVSLAEASLRLLPKALKVDYEDDESAGVEKVMVAVNQLKSLIAEAIQDDKSLASRCAGLDCLQALSCNLQARPCFESDPDLQGLLYKLLADDNDDVRQWAANIVSSLIAHGRPLCRSRAAGLWWSTMIALRTRSLSPNALERWLVSRICDADLIARHKALLALRDQALFAPEPPNLFRRDYDDIERAIGEFAERGISSAGKAMLRDTATDLEDQERTNAGRVSPIHPEGDSARLLSLIRRSLQDLSAAP